MPATFPKSKSRGRQQTKSEVSRADILIAAARLFRTEGYGATTVRNIASAAGLEPGSLYYHFESKEQILDEVLDLGVRGLFNEVKRIVEEAEQQKIPFRASFAALLETHLNFLLTESDFTSANIRNYPVLSPELRRSHRPLRRAYAALWGDFLQRARDRGDLRDDIATVPVRQFILGAMNWSVEWYDVSRYPVSMLAERMSKLLLDGICMKDVTATDVAIQPVMAEPRTIETGGKAAQTRYQILRAAARVLRKCGYKAATIRRIAAEAELEAGSVYYHFSSKTEILDDVLDLGLRELLEGVRSATRTEALKNDRNAMLSTAIATHMACLFRASEFTSANIRVYGMLPENLRSRHRKIRHEYADLWDQMLLSAQKDGFLRSDIKVIPLRQMMLGSLNWTVEWFDPDKANAPGHFTLPEFSAMLIKLLLGGISAPNKIPSPSRDSRRDPDASDKQEVV